MKKKFIEYIFLILNFFISDKLEYIIDKQLLFEIISNL